MFKYICIVIILYISFRELYECYYPEKDNKINTNNVPELVDNKTVIYNKENKLFGDKYVPNDPLLSRGSNATIPKKVIIDKVIFDKPNPWTRLDTDTSQDYPFRYFIKIKFSSLNDYQIWKQIVPNLDFNAQSGELIIPSKDEGSALGLVNLIIAQLNDHISLQDILNKNLIQISVAKAQEHEVIRSELRNQILDNISGKETVKTSDYEEDLALKVVSKSQNQQLTEPPMIPINTNAPKIDRNEKITVSAANDVKKQNTKDVEAFEGNDFSYL